MLLSRDFPPKERIDSHRLVKGITSNSFQLGNVTSKYEVIAISRSIMIPLDKRLRKIMGMTRNFQKATRKTVEITKANSPHKKDCQPKR